MDSRQWNSTYSSQSTQLQIMRERIEATLSLSPTITIALGFCIIVIITRLVSAQNSASRTMGQNGAKTVPAVPYWIPLLGHLPNMAIDAEGFVKNLRYLYGQGIFALNFGGTRHNVMYTPGLATALLNQKTSNADSEAVSNTLMKSIFGFPASEQKQYDAAIHDIMDCYKTLLSEPYLGDMVTQTADKIKENIPNLVSFLNSPVDQMPWERTSLVNVCKNGKGEEVVEASLLQLIRDFCAFTANESLMGTDFLANFPEFLDDLWIMDRAFLFLAAGLPRWLPIPLLSAARAARNRNLRRADTFHVAMEKHLNGENPGAEWSSLDDVGSLVKARLPVYKKYGFSIRARAACEHALMWAANANSNALIFWMLNHIYEDKALLAKVREEIAPYVRIEQFTNTGLPITEPPRITHMDIDGLCNNCPLLKSCYIECLRLDTASWSLKIIKQDFVLQSRDKYSQPWMLRKGDYAHAAHDLHSTDPNYFTNPMVWRANRHVKFDDKNKRSAEMGSIRPYGKL